MIFKAYKYRLYPTDIQKVLLEKHFGCARFIYNLALETKLSAYNGNKIHLSAFDLNKQVTDLKKDLPWLSEVSIGCLQQSIMQMDGAFKRFTKGLSQFPVYKKKTGRNSFRCTEGVKVLNGNIFISKFREGIGLKQHREINGTIKSAIISKTPTGKYFASVVVETENTTLLQYENTVGVDLGLKTFAVLSDGKEFASPQHLRKSLGRLKVLQRRASKKKSGSKNKIKANLQVALLHEKIANQRKDFLHKASNQITNDYGTICIEDLAVSNLKKNHCLSLSINDASWSLFTYMLSYKANWKGRNLKTIGRFIPTSKMCSNCGSIKEMPLSERTYSCECGLVLDRDINAARNIRNAGVLRTEASVELLPIGKTVKQKSSRQGDKISN